MPMPSGLTKEETEELLYSQIQTINAVLCAILPGFDSDILTFFSNEIDASTILTAASKQKLKDHMAALKEKYKKK